MKSWPSRPRRRRGFDGPDRRAKVEAAETMITPSFMGPSPDGADGGHFDQAAELTKGKVAEGGAATTDAVRSSGRSSGAVVSRPGRAVPRASSH